MKEMIKKLALLPLFFGLVLTSACNRDNEDDQPQDKIIHYTVDDLLETIHGGNGDAFDARLAEYRANPQIGKKTFIASCQWRLVDGQRSAEYFTSQLQRIKHKDPQRFALGDTVRPLAIFLDDKTWLEDNGKTVIVNPLNIIVPRPQE